MAAARRNSDGTDSGSIFHSRLNTLIGSESQSSFARRAGVSQAGLNRICNGGEPGLKTLTSIALAGGVSVAWLVGEDERRTPAHRVTEVASHGEMHLDYELLRVVIETIEQVLTSRRKTLTPDKKAELFLLAYSILKDEEDLQQGSDKIVRLAKLAG